MHPVIANSLSEHLAALQTLPTLSPDIEALAERLIQCYQQGGKLLICGNGGSAADAQHIAAELVGRFLHERAALPAIALNVNDASLTAIANDYGYAQVFARQIEAYGQANDVLIGISTSGNSANVLAAVEAATVRGLYTVGLTGASGGKLKQSCATCLCVPTDNTPRIQEMHILVGHILCQLLENAMLSAQPPIT